MGLYRLLTDLGGPLIALWLRGRQSRGREERGRLKERFGVPSLLRPPGPLVWCHAASVGEALSALALLEALRKNYPAVPILLTTGTVASARLIAPRLPSGVFHQYAPTDRRAWVARFLDHWRPGLALWMESELWPNTLELLRARNIPAILLNGRLSGRSFQRWNLAKGWADALMKTFVLGFAQTAIERDRFETLGLPEVHAPGNLKYAAAPLPDAPETRAALAERLGRRPFWLMASTHPGEEALALEAHAVLRKTWPELLLILAPRHAARGPALAKDMQAQGWRVACRSTGAWPGVETDVYLADTMGELGVFYRLAPVVALGGSFTWGGHNPIEPAQLGRAPIFGPRMTNFAEIAEDMLEAGAATRVEDPGALAQALEAALRDPETEARKGASAQAFAENRRDVLETILGHLRPWFAQLLRDAGMETPR